MASKAAILETVKALQGLAEANRADFERQPELVGAYEAAIRTGKFRYVPDPETCGLPDCWSSFKGLYDRYPIGPILLDCEDIACAHAAYLTVQGVSSLVGLRPGRRIAHCVCGVDRGQDEDPALIDPSVDCGMPEMPEYDDIYWLPVRRARTAKIAGGLETGGRSLLTIGPMLGWLGGDPKRVLVLNRRREAA